ncbi:MAG: hypothetical protein ACK2UL_00470, partial [Anaerolineae bacterium]
ASQKHIRRILLQQLDLRGLMRDSMVMLPELMEVVRRSPLVMSETLRFLEDSMKTQQRAPLAGLRGTIFAAACVVGGAIVAAFGGPWWLWATLIISGFVLATGNWVTSR